MTHNQAGSRAQRPLRVAVVGSGPAGFYAAEHLLKQDSPIVSVDMFEKLPAPFGLVRYGVAPDHPKIKSVQNVYEKTAAHPRFRFFGNVEVGREITVDRLRDYYHQIVFTVGAQSDRRLSLPGLDAKGCYSATEFVAWYNGHPDFNQCRFDFSSETAVIIGIGNVALDVARILTRTQDELKQTDIADYALDALAESRVKDVVLLGRRGVAQAAFTPTEARELGQMDDVAVVVRPEETFVPSEYLSGADRQTRRNVDIVQAYAQTKPPQKSKRIHLRFLISPTHLNADEDGRLQSVCLVKNELYKNEKGQIKPRATGEEEILEAGLLFSSIGYRGEPLNGIPFDDWSGTFCNEAGRIINPLTRTHRIGEYAAGWIKRGATGIIGTNRACAVETVEKMVEDARRGEMLRPLNDSAEAAEQMIREAQPRFVSFADWQYLNELEEKRGLASGRPRIKFTDRESMLRALGKRG